MAVQNSFLVSCSASTAFDCAIRTLKTFQTTEKLYINQQFLTVTTTIKYQAPGEALSILKVITITIRPQGKTESQIQLTCDHTPVKSLCKGGVLYTIAEFLDRYSQILAQMAQESAPQW